MSNKSQLFTSANNGVGVDVVRDESGTVIALGVFCRDRHGDCVLVGYPDHSGNFVLTRGTGPSPGEWPQPAGSRVVVGSARFGTLDTDPGLAYIRFIDTVLELGPTTSPPAPVINSLVTLLPVTS